MEGTVYEWVDAPASFKGQIHIDEEVDLNSKNLQPLANVHLSCTYYATATSDTTGSFVLGTVGGTGIQTERVTAEKEGYYTVEESFLHDAGGDDYNVIIIMVREQEE